MTKFATACTPNFLNATVAKEIGGPGGTGGQGVEALLDVEYASAVAGNIPMWNVYSKTYSLEDYVKTLAALADGQIPLINSVSYGNDEIQQTSTAYMYACNTQFMAIGSRGVSIMFASGDQVRGTGNGYILTSSRHRASLQLPLVPPLLTLLLSPSYRVFVAAQAARARGEYSILTSPLVLRTSRLSVVQTLPLRA
jgi:hypothetical protein